MNNNQIPKPIPGPRGYPLLGNIQDVDPNSTLKSFTQLSDQYGEIFRLRFPGQPDTIIVSSFDLADDLLDDNRFRKAPKNALAEVRNGVHDGLFTAHLEEPNWAIAHRVLMPAFGPKGIRDMFDEMHDIASQLVLKWARQGPHQRILVSDDFTRLAMDTLGLCSMGFRFNNFYSENEHSFVKAMGDFLSECGRRGQRPPLPDFFFRTANDKYAADISILRETAEAVLRERVADSENERKDLLTAMLRGRDSMTGKKMTDESIIDNLITFLIAGHETTSGTLSYAMYELLQKPEEYRKVREEVDRVIGTGPITVDHMTKLPYIEAVLRETLRLDSPIPVLTRQTHGGDEMLRGKYAIGKDDVCLVLLSKLHVDPNVYDDPKEFRPERMLSENFNKLPKNAWKPFGHGVRACIGRPFAWQEAVLAMALLFQNFDFESDDPNYQLENKQTLTIKPQDFYVKASLRKGITSTSLCRHLQGTKEELEEADQIIQRHRGNGIAVGNNADLQPMTILYGSNSGTCESMAQRLATDAPAHGYRVTLLDSLDSGTGNLARDQPTVIFTASYEGQPPDNAGKFVQWLESEKAKDELKGVPFAVFGCGNSEWPQTFHRIPKLVNESMSANGAERLVDMGLANAASEDCFVAFENWEDQVLWPVLEARNGGSSSPTARRTTASLLQTQVYKTRHSILKLDMKDARVLANRTLTAEGESMKKHIEVELPAGTAYRSGDYLTVLPTNPHENVLRAIRRFQLPQDANIVIEGAGKKLPTGVPTPIQSILGGYVELGLTATRKDVKNLATAASAQSDREKLETLSSDQYEPEISLKRVSVLDLLEQYPSIDISFGEFLSVLPSIRVRQYSISSAPAINQSVVSLTYSVVRSPAKSGHGDFIGVATSYLASLQPGDLISAAVRPSHEAFHLPKDPENTPIIMVSAGTGIAPFRAFVQERAAMIAAGQKVAPALLYHGCRSAGKDDLYAQELADWESQGAVRVKRAFSREPRLSAGCKYVQDRVWADRQSLLNLWRKGAFVFVCGSKEISRAMDDMALRFKQEIAASKKIPITEEAAKNWWIEQRNVRYAIDVFD
ncbi:hypothetical protein PFICI_13799 [Pestalotiopsis fici W106-1]|uniref:Bifunctional cytochrome P450/NADPH--P450 reductase n=1 Tax=Pestalotiopsis fici (strain W106-1 / CGMCC3.15140) TaxID=1229662 RepID=W3WJ77_PESFW|nr:uncharacterized protein PFICI_13799 [Pestalotiopsis fici W106-1]ETS73933.1 hypothetical protein PFICI_13799 [Pestalotiopsis fici W106-1]